ncbi:MAG: riboflavin synthase [Candidatus Latescibacterota bacterium]|nr:riboflavin synthase [Candidatus Latescibacterota bacterium]MEE2627036.1 riboflavin synthase [Candidatus Latescibacterota bacterium]MEE2727564.1 riboflavin synthase [Candidatus Latescibacterota bacterium]
MFTGIVEEVGHVRHIARQGEFQRMQIAAQRVLEDVKMGDSINVDGVCQTVVHFDPQSFSVETVSETLSRTTLGQFQSGRPVNLERALCPGDRLGGHIVQGHVDGVGHVRSVQERQGEWRIQITAPSALHRYIAEKGSITIDGTSLTVAELSDEGFTISVIPHTFDQTVLSQRRTGDAVNLEVDVLARYIERLLAAGADTSAGLSFESLRNLGY